MQTQSHLLIVAFAERQLQPRLSVPIATGALLFGSILPDVPFWLLTLLGEAWFLWFHPLPGVGDSATAMQVMEYLHFTLFFTDPLWIISHNFFHSLIITGVLMGMGWWGMRRQRRTGGRGGRWLFWLALGAFVHTLIDIPTHSSDGPLIFFPLNWTYRYHSPVSYWESTSYGWVFVAFELMLDALLLGYFGWVWWKTRRGRRPASISR